MKKIMLSGMGFVGAAVMMLSLSGCAESNEKSANITSTPPPSGQAPPSNQEEYYKRQQSLQKSAYSGYPGSGGRSGGR